MNRNYKSVLDYKMACTDDKLCTDFQWFFSLTKHLGDTVKFSLRAHRVETHRRHLKKFHTPQLVCQVCSFSSSQFILIDSSITSQREGVILFDISFLMYLCMKASIIKDMSWVKALLGTMLNIGMSSWQ